MPEEVEVLQRILEEVPRYAILSTGRAPANDAAKEVFAMLPKGKTYEDKLVLGVFEGEIQVGCTDLIRAYPDSESLFIGLLLLSEKHEERGLGAVAAHEIEQFVAPWGYRRIKLGVIDTNDRALAFWSKLGFAPTGEVKPFRCGAVNASFRVFAKLTPAAHRERQATPTRSHESVAP